MEKKVLSLIETFRSQSLFSPEEKPKVSLLAGDGSTRTYWRIHGEDKSFILCLDETDSRELMVKNSCDVHSAYTENNVPVPNYYQTNSSDGYILQEDLGDLSLGQVLSMISSPHEEYALYQKILDILIKVHSINPERYPHKNFSTLAFDTEKLMWEVNFTLTHFIQGHLGVNLPEKLHKVLTENFLQICEKLSSAERVVTHRDFHSRNIMLSRKEFVLIDFQDSRMGIPQYDLVSLLDDCYYRIHPENYARLKRYYWDKFLNQRKLQASWDEFNYYYDLMAIQRIFKALGSFGYISRTKNNPKFIRYIGYAFENLRVILSKHSEYSELRKTLAGIYYGP